MGGGKGQQAPDPTSYRLSIHYAACAGPVDEIVDLIVNDRSLGLPSVTANSEQFIDNMNLFGGSEKGGGVRGRIFYLLGGAFQVLPPFLAAKLGRTPETVTGYRNIASVWFTGEANEGFTWSTNMPSVPAAEIKLRRAPKGLAGNAMIGEDANGAHIIYEGLTNTDWGRGYLAAQINETSFLNAAQTLRDEVFGLSMLWSGEGAIEPFLADVARHIGALIYHDPTTGLHEIKMLRGDYDPIGLPRITPRVAEMKSFQRRSWGETVNQVILEWTNPENEELETVRSHDATGFAIQKTAVSDSPQRFPGIRNQELALTVADREQRQAGSPLAAVEVDLSIAFGKVSPGDVVWFDWDDVDSDGDVFAEPFVARVVKVKPAKRGAAHYEVTLLEDVFAYTGAVTAAQPSLFVPPEQFPIDLPAVSVIDSPYFVVARLLGDAAAEALQYPVGHLSFLAYSGQADLRDIHLYSLRPVPEQAPAYLPLKTIPDAGRFTITGSALIPESETVLTYPVGYTPSDVEIGGFILLGDGPGQEICVVTGYTSTDVTLRRGALDTVPKAWPIGTSVWELLRTANVSDETEVLVGETQTYKLLPTTSIQQLPLASATAHAATVGDRLYRPLRPGNVRVSAAEGFAFSVDSAATSLDIAWSNRNRTLETTQVLDWTAASVTPEAGQTTAIELRNGASVLASATGLSGGSTTLDLTSAGLTPGMALTLAVWSERDGFESWQEGEFAISIT